MSEEVKQVVASIAEVSAAGRLVEARLESAAVGEVVTYDDLSNYSGLADVTKQRSVIAAARRRLRKRLGMVFVCLAKIGYRRADDHVKLAAAEHHQRKSLKQARETIAVAVTIDAGALDQTETGRLNKTLLQAHISVAVSSSRSKRLEQAADVPSNRQILRSILKDK